MSHPPPEEKTDEPSARTIEDRREKKPALDCKRAKFSLKTNPSQLFANLDASLNIKELRDPEEFFLAYERLENAQREIGEQKGWILNDLDMQNASTAKRHRRSVRYRHCYLPMAPESNENFTFHKAFESESLSPPKLSLQKFNDENASVQDRDIPGSIDETANKANELVDEILSINCKDLEENEPISLLKGQLHIKPINLEQLRLPEPQDVQTLTLEPSSGDPKKRKKAFCNVGNLLRRLTPAKIRLRAENSFHKSSSPTSQKSPFSSILSLLRHSLLADSLNDPFSVGNFDPAGCRSREQCSIFKEFISRSTEQNRIAVFDFDSSEMTGGDFGNAHVETLTRQQMKLAEKNIPTAVASANKRGKKTSCSHRHRRTKKISERQSIPEDSTSRKSGLRRSTRIRTRPLEYRKGERVLHGSDCSFPEDNTSWKSGVRRSTRIRTRPLEYWKGERLLYGRVNESLATVIGLKYVSSTDDDGQPILTVKSFVSDEFKELVELAALH